MTEQAPKEVDKTTKAEHFGFAVETFARGPDTILYGSLWVPVVLYLASLDGICSTFENHASGANGKSCLHDSHWNETLWSQANGTDCIQTGDFDTQKYTHNTDLPGCAQALATYRTALATATDLTYTCNCTGDYSLLGSGMRPQNIFVVQNWVNSILIAFASPLFGSLLDSRGQRKQRWKVLIVVAAVSIAGTAILATGGVWIVSLVFFACLHVTTELVWLIKASYLGDIAQDSATKLKLGGDAQKYSFGAQLIFVVIAVGMVLALGDATLATQIACGINILWWVGFEWLAMSKFQTRPATRPTDGALIGDAFKSIRTSLRTLWTKYPEAGKYLIFHALGAAGPSQFLGYYATYFTQQMKLDSTIILALSACCLFFGMLAAQLFNFMSSRVSIKKLWIFIMALWVVTMVVTPLVVYKEGDVVSALAFGATLYAVGLSWYFSIGWSAFVTLIPPGTEGEFGGAYTFVGFAGGWFTPMMIYAVVQATNDTRLGLLVIAFWCFVGLVFVCFIDFDKGKKEAGRVDSGGVVVAASGVGSSVPGAVVTADGDAASEIQVEAVSM